MPDEKEVLKENLSKRIAGEIVLSPSPGAVIQKWRNIFKIPQRQLAEEMGIMPSVISDYESGRRKSPGAQMIKKIVNSFLKIDEEKGSNIAKEFTNLDSKDILSDAILDIKEFSTAVKLREFVEIVKGDVASCEEELDKEIYGYTIIDSFKAILELGPSELVRLYGLTTERVMIFTRVERGRSPLVAIKVTNLKPGAIIFHGVKEVDKLACRIAKVEGIPIIISKLDTAEELINNLKNYFYSQGK